MAVRNVLQWLWPRRAEPAAVERALRELSRERRPVTLELDGQALHFRSTLAVTRRVVVASKPPGLGRHLKEGHVLRLTLPEWEDRVLRLPVRRAQYTLSGGGGALVCDRPPRFAREAPRRAARYPTRRFSNVEVYLPGMGETLRVLELSRVGLQALVPYYNMSGLFPLHRPVGAGELRVGDRSARLEGLTPRRHLSGRVAMEFRAGDDDASREALDTVLRLLEQRLQQWLYGG